MTSTALFAELCCPVCRGALRETGTTDHELRCDQCQRTYPVVLGIPDLRIFADPYIDLEADRAKGRRIAERFDDTDTAGLIAFYYSITDTVPEDQARRFTAGLMAAPQRAAASLDVWRRLAPASATGRLVEVGCGTAPLLVSAAPAFASAIGVDIAFRWLIVARKRLAEAGLDVPLVCACAEALPLKDTSADVVACDSVLEVTREPVRAAAEAFRITRPGGRLWVATPNRWSLGPDPHVGAPAGGWWPDAWLAAWAQRRGALPPRRSLLSAGSLKDLLGRTGYRDVTLALPDVAAGQLSAMDAPARAAARAYQAIKDLPLAHQALLAVGPVLLAGATRPAR